MVALRSLDPLFPPSLLLFLLLPATSFRARKEDATSPRAIRRARIIRFSIPSFSQREISKGTIPSPCFYPGKISRERKDRPTASMSIPRNVDTSQVKFARYANTVVERAYLYAFVRSRRERRGGTSLYVHRRIGRNSTGERFRRWRVCKAIAF